MVSSLSGCSVIPKFGFGDKTPDVKPVEVITKPLEKTPLNLKVPDPIKTKSIEWVLITPDNAEHYFKELEAKGANLVLFAMTPDGYQALSYTIADLRNLINTQRQIILRYKEYYEPQTLEEKKEEAPKENDRK